MIGKKDTISIFEQYRNVLKEQTTDPEAAPVAKTNVQQQNVGDIVKQIRNEVDSQELNKALSVIQKSTLPSNLKSQIEQLLKNGNVIAIFKQIQGLSSDLTKDPDMVNLQAGSVSEPGSPSATGFKQP